jgi:hypothetical protein
MWPRVVARLNLCTQEKQLLRFRNAIVITG